MTAANNKVYVAHGEFGDAHPGWMGMALAAINRWGRNEVTLAQAIGEALIEASALGGEPEYTTPARPKVIRRGRPAPTATRVIRRAR